MRHIRVLSLIAITMGSWTLRADPLQITDGISGTKGGANGSCASNCDFTPNNLLTGTDLGLYIPSNSDSAAQEILVFLVPNDTTDLLHAQNPLGAITLYNSSLTKISEATSSAFATPTNASAFGLGTGSLSYTGADGFYGSISGNSGSIKVGSELGINLSNSINMSNVTTESNSGTDTFGVYAFLISADIGGQDLLDIKVPLGLPPGTFVSAVTDTGLANPNSSAGVTDAPSPVPEPSSIVLFGIAILGLSAVARNRMIV
jgi:PEP-CTERM motif-containing protein